MAEAGSSTLRQTGHLPCAALGRPKREGAALAEPQTVEKHGSAEASPSQRLEEWEEVWTGDFIFENEWQSFRTKKDRSLELTSASREFAKDKKRVKIAVKVVDIFGNDTMTIVDVAVGGKNG